MDFKTFVYIVYEAGNVKPAIDLCKGLATHTGLQPVIFCPYYLPDTEEYVKTASSFSIIYIYEHNALGGLCDIYHQLEGFGLAVGEQVQSCELTNNHFRLKFITKIINQIFPDKEATFLSFVEFYTNRIIGLHVFLKRLKAKFIILGEDNIERDSPCWIRAAKLNSVKSLIVTHGSLTPDEAAIAYFSNPDYSVTTKKEKIILLFYRKWLRSFRGKLMVRLPLERLLALEVLGLDSVDPWVVNSGQADHVVLESNFMKEMYVAHGINPESIAICGSPSIDKLHAAYEKFNSSVEFRSSYSLNIDKPTLVCALPPNQYPGVICPEADTYSELVKLWLSLLKKASSNFNIVISTHPSMTKNDLSSVSESDFYIYDGGVADLLPHSDLYLASVSTSIRWALIYGIPVVNFDCYQYDHPDYVGVKGVETCGSYKEAEALIEKFSNLSCLSNSREELSAISSRYGRPDGRSVAHIFDLVQ